MCHLAFSHFIRYQNQERQSTSYLYFIKSQDNGRYFTPVRSAEELVGPKPMFWHKIKVQIIMGNDILQHFVKIILRKTVISPYLIFIFN